jgi:hypothetical protein
MERSLLFDNKGCLKCRCFFVKHHAADCLNDFPLAVGYEVLTNDDMNAAHRKQTNAVAMVAESSRGLGNLPVATIMPPTNDHAILEGDSSDLSKDSDDSVSDHSVPLSIPHYFWKCAVDDRHSVDCAEIEVLIDNGSHTVLIHDELVNRLGLRCRTLNEPMNISLEVSELNNHIVQTLTEWVKLKLHDPNDSWSSRTVHAVVTPGLCTDIILGLPFLCTNKIVIDHEQNTCVAKASGYDLLHPPP